MSAILTPQKNLQTTTLQQHQTCRRFHRLPTGHKWNSWYLYFRLLQPTSNRSSTWEQPAVDPKPRQYSRQLLWKGKKCTYQTRTPASPLPKADILNICLFILLLNYYILCFRLSFLNSLTAHHFMARTKIYIPKRIGGRTDNFRIVLGTASFRTTRALPTEPQYRLFISTLINWDSNISLK